MPNVHLAYFPVELKMHKSSAPKNALFQINNGMFKGYKDFILDLSNANGGYPNTCTPIAAILDYFESCDCSFSPPEIPSDRYRDYIYHTSFWRPKLVENMMDSTEINYPFNKVWRFGTSEGVNALVNAFISYSREFDVLGEGVLTGLEWCINETMDNVLQHSALGYGFVMGSIFKEQKRFNICICDAGIGIYNSLKTSKHRPGKALDAITLALQEKVTRDEHIGQGNGMWGLSEIIKENNGYIKVSSCKAEYIMNDGEVTTSENGGIFINEKCKNTNGMTLIDFQLDYSKTIDVVKALGGYRPLDLWLDERELVSGEIEIHISQDSHGTGTRQAAAKLRNSVLNALFETKQKVILDFTGVNLVSSSYADELIGKIISEYGLVFFMNMFRLTNISKVNSDVINRSVEQRMAQKYYDSSIASPED